jgi:hypothetical protein
VVGHSWCTASRQYDIALWDLIDKDGYASLPEGTRLCCEVDETKLAEFAKQPIVAERPTRGRMKGGSIADF